MNYSSNQIVSILSLDLRRCIRYRHSISAHLFSQRFWQDLDLDGPPWYVSFRFSNVNHAEFLIQVKCIASTPKRIRGLIFLERAVLRTRLKNLGCKTRQSVITSCLVPYTMKSAIVKVRCSYTLVCLWFLCVLVIQQCALERDLELFEAGDSTEVGEKGVTLRSVILYSKSFLLQSLRMFCATVEDKRQETYLEMISLYSTRTIG